jgi:hypothetical protein
VLAIETSRARPWGEIDGISALPESIHPPISAARLWSSAGLAAVLALAVGTLVLWNREERAEYPLEADPTWEAGSLTVRFDVDDLAYVDIYAISTAGLRAEVVSRSPADKAALATGEGDFLLGVSGSALVLVSNDEPMGDLRDAIVGSVDSREGRQEIRKRIRARHPKADVLVLPAYPPS